MMHFIVLHTVQTKITFNSVTSYIQCLSYNERSLLSPNYRSKLTTNSCHYHEKYLTNVSLGCVEEQHQVSIAVSTYIIMFAKIVSVT